ncbi:nucleotidyltransferase domain-containing protein [Brachybacterium alimentarium]|uniref:nucleotidyltransferase domain-containing protein n=1 Tax=Brachybacterium alimentarium TaxID=47845 RepID=UPI003FD50C35
MADFVERARSFVRSRYPQACAAFLGGSAASGDATESSDLDVLVVLPDEWSTVAFVETTTYKGQLVEAFVYGGDALEDWLGKGRAQARPVLDRLIGQGQPLLQGRFAEELASASQKVLGAGPPPAETVQLKLRRYSLSAVVDDLRDAEDRGVRAVVMSTAWREAAELALLSKGCWIGTGKWLLRELRAHDDPFGLASWVDQGGHDAVALEERCRKVLDSVGGHLQSGFVRGDKPSDL